LGWFQIQTASRDLEATAPDDVEWVLAKCAGFNAGCSWVTSLETLRTLGQTSAILTAIRDWDRARHAGVFSDNQRPRLKDPTREFHLEAMGEARWQLTPVAYSPRFVRQWGRTQTRPATASPWEVENQFDSQPLQFILRVASVAGTSTGGHVADPTFEVGGNRLVFPVRLKAREYLVGQGDGKGLVYDANWNLMQSVQAGSAAPTLRNGKQRVDFRCETPTEFESRVEIRFKMVGAPEPVG